MSKVWVIFLLGVCGVFLSSCNPDESIQNQPESQVQLQEVWNTPPSPSPIGILNPGNSLGF